MSTPISNYPELLQLVQKKGALVVSTFQKTKRGEVYREAVLSTDAGKLVLLLPFHTYNGSLWRRYMDALPLWRLELESHRMADSIIMPAGTWGFEHDNGKITFSIVQPKTAIEELLHKVFCYQMGCMAFANPFLGSTRTRVQLRRRSDENSTQQGIEEAIACFGEYIDAVKHPDAAGNLQSVTEQRLIQLLASILSI